MLFLLHFTALMGGGGAVGCTHTLNVLLLGFLLLCICAFSGSGGHGAGECDVCDLGGEGVGT